MRPETPRLCSIYALDSERALRLYRPPVHDSMGGSLGQARAPRHRGVLGGLFAALAALDPHAVAVSMGEKSLRRGALLSAADALARRLRARGARVGTPVVVCMERSIDAVVAALGVLRAGAVCLPIDPALPLARQVRMAAAVGAELQVSADARALPGLEAAALYADDPGGDLPNLGPEDAAYLLFVPSATGSPKAVTLPHRAIARLADLEPGQTVAMLASPSSGVSVAELWGALLSGARLEVAADEDLARWLTARRPDVVTLTPSALRGILADRPAALATLRRLTVIDSEDPGLLRAAAEACGGQVDNGFLMAEAGIFIASQGIASERRVDLALPGTRLYVHDAAGRPASPGEVGELWVGGDAVALGYWGEPANAAFREDPHGGRRFRTGERACWTGDGALLRMGRGDDRVLIDGQPVEPAEVEAALLAHPAIRAAAVLSVGLGDEKRLCAWVVGREAREDSLWAHLRARLPEALIPAEIAWRAALPMTSGRSVDRRALVAPADPPRLRVVQ